MKLLALIALVPISMGPVPQEERTLTLNLCLSGEITIPIGDKDGEHDGNCRNQGCHAGTCRQRDKPVRR